MEADDLKTRRSLIDRLRNLEDQASWREFFNTYWKLIYSVALKAGLTEDEAEEVVQETVITVVKQIDSFAYDPNVSTFKHWLLHKTEWRIIDQIRKRPPDFLVRARRRADDTARTPTVERVPDPASLRLEAVWDEEWEKNLIDAAMERIKSRVKVEHYQIFYLSAVKKMPARKVAELIGVNVAQVYLVKHRLAGQVKREIDRLKRKDWQP